MMDQTIVVLQKGDLEEIVERAVRRALQNKTAVQDRPPQLTSEWVQNEEVIKSGMFSRPTLYRYRKSGKLPYSKVNTKIFYKRSDIDALIERDYV